MTPSCRSIAHEMDFNGWLRCPRGGGSAAAAKLPQIAARKPAGHHVGTRSPAPTLRVESARAGRPANSGDEARWFMSKSGYAITWTSKIEVPGSGIVECDDKSRNTARDIRAA